MFCQKCGIELLDTLKFCVKCGHRLRAESGISNKAMLVAGIAAVVSVGVALLGSLPRSDLIQARGEPSPTMAVVLSSPRTSPSLKPTQKPKPTLEPNDLRRHGPTLIYPDDGTLFSYVYSSGKIVFRWKLVAGSSADKYKIEVEYGNPSHQPPWPLREFETPWNYCTVEFVGVPATEFNGRWRVTPIFADGRSGVPTEWRTFQFTK